jgi:hypothetical protein
MNWSERKNGFLKDDSQPATSVFQYCLHRRQKNPGLRLFDQLVAIRASYSRQLRLDLRVLYGSFPRNFLES